MAGCRERVISTSPLILLVLSILTYIRLHKRRGRTNYQENLLEPRRHLPSDPPSKIYQEGRRPLYPPRDCLFPHQASILLRACKMGKQLP